MSAHYARRRIGENVSVRFAIGLYLSGFSAPMNRNVAGLFRALLRRIPNLAERGMHSLAREPLMQQALAVATSSRQRLLFSLLLTDFFDFAERYGWGEQELSVTENE